jgi:hypothetical protein
VGAQRRKAEVSSSAPPVAIQVSHYVACILAQRREPVTHSRKAIRRVEHGTWLVRRQIERLHATPPLLWDTAMPG